MRIKAMLQTAAVIGLAVVAGLLGVAGTWALWNASASADMGTIQSADFRVELNGTPMAVDGAEATVTVDPSGTLTPTTPVYASVTVKNATNAGGRLTILAELGHPEVSSASNDELADYVIAEAALMPTSGQCTDLDENPAPAAATIAGNGSASFCIKTSLQEDAPETLTQSIATVTIPVEVSQIPPTR